MKSRGPKLFKPAKTTQKPWRDTLDILDLCDDGRGLGRRGGKAVFVRGALMGERVQARSERISGRYDEAVATQIDAPALERIEPRCRHFEQCGGCQLQHMSEQSQRDHKARRFSEMLSRLAAIDAVRSPLTGQCWEYRHRLRLHFATHKGQLQLGFRASKSRNIVEVPGCQVLRPALTAALTRLYEHKQSLQALRSGMLMLAEAAEGSISAHLTLDRRPGQSVLNRFLAEFANAATGIAVASISVSGERVWEHPEYPISVYPGQNWQFQPDDFSQANPEINSAMVNQVCAWLDAQTDDKVLDAFSGLGNFSLALAASGAAVTGIELDAAMVERAKANAATLKQLRFVQADLFSDSFRLPAGINKLVLDPPRAGAAALCRVLAQSGIERLVYVSCDPATLERDAAILLAGGYTLREARWADMFPQTYHMESLCLFERVVV